MPTSSGSGPPAEQWSFEQAAAIDALELLVISTLLRLEEEMPSGRLLVDQILADAFAAVEHTVLVDRQHGAKPELLAMRTHLERIGSTLSAARR